MDRFTPQRISSTMCLRVCSAFFLCSVFCAAEASLWGEWFVDTVSLFRIMLSDSRMHSNAPGWRGLGLQVLQLLPDY